MPLTIKISPYLYDHQLAGRAVFPAAEILIELARAVKINFPQTEINNLTDAFFPRFLSVPAEAKNISVSVRMREVRDGVIEASLCTKVVAHNISRILEHGRVKLSVVSGKTSPESPIPLPDEFPEDGFNVPREAVYEQLVPFGKAYRNIAGDFSLSRAGALADISGGDGEAGDDLLGSPFPFDAVLHMACVWGQRFSGMVPFPVGFAGRTVYRKTKRRTFYRGFVVPAGVEQRTLIFDAWIYDLRGAVCEAIRGIRMQDITRGRVKPPEWIRAK